VHNVSIYNLLYMGMYVFQKIIRVIIYINGRKNLQDVRSPLKINLYVEHTLEKGDEWPRASNIFIIQHIAFVMKLNVFLDIT